MRAILRKLFSLSAVLPVLGLSDLSQGQVVVNVIRHFNPATDGSQLVAPVIEGTDGSLYGMAENGGTNGYGTIFKVNKDGSAFQVLHHFNMAGPDLYNPEGSLVQGPDGNLYGIPGEDSAFRINTNGEAYAIIHGSRGGTSMATLLRGQDGMFYGTSMQLGSNGFGRVYKFNTAGTDFSVIHDFGTNSIEGQSPFPGLLQSPDGLLFGTAGGGAENAGIVYRLNTNGDGYAVMHYFSTNGADGRFPLAPLLKVSDGTIYGTTAVGGSNNLGTIFKLNSDGTGYQVVYHFKSEGGTKHSPSPVRLIQAGDHK